MAVKNYRGVYGKNLWENGEFHQGMVHTNETIGQGAVKALANFDINQTGGSMRTREPLFSSGFLIEGDESPRSLTENTFLFKSRQDDSKEFFIEIGAPKKVPNDKTIRINEDFEVIDGDTFRYQGDRYRLLGIDAPEIDTDKGKDAKQYFIDNLTNGTECTFKFDKEMAFKDTYGRYLGWLICDGFDTNTNNVAVAMLHNGYARLMGEYEPDIEELFIPYYDLVTQQSLKDARTNGMSSGSDGSAYASGAHIVNFSYSNEDIEVYSTYGAIGGDRTTGYVKSVVSKDFRSKDLTKITLNIPFDSLIDYENGSSRLEILSVSGTTYNIALGTIGALSVNTIVWSDVNSGAYVDGDVFALEFTFSEVGITENTSDIDFRFTIDASGDQSTAHLEDLFVNGYTIDAHYNSEGGSYTLTSGYPKGNLLNIYSKPRETSLTAFKETEDSIKLPMLNLSLEQTLDIGTLYEDLELPRDYGISLELKQKQIEYSQELLKYKSAYKPFEYLSHMDAVAFIIVVRDTNTDEVLYEGLATIDYHVPLNDNTNKPDFENYKFRLSTYGGENIYKIKYEDHVRNSMNLLQKNRPILKSYYGQNARDNGYNFYELLGVRVLNKHGRAVTHLRDDEDYVIKPYFAIPDLTNLSDIATADTPENYYGYAIKWEVLSNSETITKTIDGEEVTRPKVLSTSGWVYAFDNKGMPVAEETHGTEFEDWFKGESRPKFELSTTDPLIRNHMNSQMVVNVSIARVSLTGQEHTRQDGYYYPESSWKEFKDVDDSFSELSTPIMSVILDYTRNYEDYQNLYEHNQDLSKCTGLSYYDGYTILYGSPKAPNVVYISDNQNVRYFPFKYALDQFKEEVIHVHPHSNGILVFTTSDIYMISLMQTEEGISFFQTSVVSNNLSIKPWNRNTVRSVGKDVMFMSTNAVYILRPNPFSDDPTDMNAKDISGPIRSLFANPVPYITRRMQYYGVVGDIFSTGWTPEIEFYTIVKNDEIWVHMSVHLPISSEGEQLMIVAIYNRETGTWRTYDTKAMSFPYNHKVFDPTEGYHVLVRNHNELDNGVTLMLNEGLNLWDFDEGYGRLFDTKVNKIVSGHFVFNSVEVEKDTEGMITNMDAINKIKQPIRPYIMTGYMKCSPHLSKRYHKGHFEVTNIDALEIPVSLEFTIDGRVRQTSNAVRMEQITDINHPDYGKLYEEYQMKPFVVSANETMEGGTSFKTWQLGMSKFAPGNKMRIKFGISGKGKIPALELGLQTTGRFEFFKYGIIYKEHDAR